MNFVYRPADHFVAWNIFVRTEYVLGSIVSIDVGGNKIQRDIVSRAMFYENIHPCSLGGCGTSHAKPGIHLLNGASSVIIKLPVGCLFRLACPEINVGFIPDFEIPSCNLIDAVSLD